jgi:hypothetical protein
MSVEKMDPPGSDEALKTFTNCAVTRNAVAVKNGLIVFCDS